MADPWLMAANKALRLSEPESPPPEDPPRSMGGGGGPGGGGGGAPPAGALGGAAEPEATGPWGGQKIRNVVFEWHNTSQLTCFDICAWRTLTVNNDRFIELLKWKLWVFVRDWLGILDACSTGTSDTSFGMIIKILFVNWELEQYVWSRIYLYLNTFDRMLHRFLFSLTLSMNLQKSCFSSQLWCEFDTTF